MNVDSPVSAITICEVPSAFLFTNLDKYFAKFIIRQSMVKNDEVRLAALLVSNASMNGHVCFDLAFVAKSHVTCDEIPTLTQCPDLDEWLSVLKKSVVVGSPGNFVPLILDGSKLYLHRFFTYENSVADFISSRTSTNSITPFLGHIARTIDSLFPLSDSGETNWQHVAATTAIQGSFTVISGGPGTGKTTTIAKIISLYMSGFQQNDLVGKTHAVSSIRIALAAPTGKAATRLKNAVLDSLTHLVDNENLTDNSAPESYTIHRLLGVIPHSPLFRHTKDNPLPFDLVIVDEASMIDLSLMAALTSAISEKTQLILLGDKDQLSSVEAGAVFGDICNTRDNNFYSSSDITHPLAKRIVHLKKSYRFSSDSGIGKIAALINNGQAREAWELLQSNKVPGVSLRQLPEPAMLPQTLGEIIYQRFKDYASAPSFTQAYSMFESFRVLCGLRGGPYGVENVNYFTEQLLEEEHVLPRNTEWYHGRPVMITRNDPALGLYNGDVGLVMNDPDGSHKACFTGDTPDKPRKFYPLRLPAHETAYATTVHKSQGSEFGHVVLLLPKNDSQVLTRELLYTAITRAKESVEIWCHEGVFMNAVNRRVERMSGLQERLWGNDSILDAKTLF